MAQWLGTLATFPEDSSSKTRCEGAHSLCLVGWAQGILGPAWPAQQAPWETKGEIPFQ